MTDRLEGIKSRYEKPPTVWDSSVQEDVRYLVAKVEALESELAYLRDHPGWIPPIPPDEAEQFKSFIEKHHFD